ncbi:hypothetical protein [Geofilum rubicundum]|uniref:Outer membrane protein beta-barrel domain-containing protein n=1 Tax=Geofilum rubicundum JCM 15548 TaxID=1236989 RepID=A0A0E9M1B4_9BACT|nr:hypothetical protein [Geofilum rubicundum]GAO31269.1 hypothetical protein JCM15548_13617 [Geofilum rubicundum JCM 15548]
MKTNKKIMLVGWFLMTGAFVFAQNQEPAPTPAKSGIVLHLGPSVNYFQGQQSGSYQEFERKRINFQLNAFLGYLSPRGGASNSIGVFGTAGYTNEYTLDEILSIQDIDVINLESSSYNTFYQIEGGMIISNALRLSTGVGSQDYSTALSDESLDYLSSTAGLMINFGNVMWSLDANINYGWDYTHTTLKFSTGLILVF